MAQSRNYQRANYALPAYNFRVDVGGVTMNFSDVSGINMEYETVTYRHGLSFSEGEILRKFYYDKYVPITLKRGTVVGANELYEWLKSKDLRHLDVSLCDEAGSAVVRWSIRKAVPVKLEAPTFDAATNEVAIESLEVSAAGISVEHLE